MEEVYNPLVGEIRRPVPQEEFENEVKNKHFVYTYSNGWNYEFYVSNDERIVYEISGGPMAGRLNYQTAYYQRIRKNLWQINWLEETGTIVSLVLDIDMKTATTFIVFSKGHLENADAAHVLTMRIYSNGESYLNSVFTRTVICCRSSGPIELPKVVISWPTL